MLYAKITGTFNSLYPLQNCPTSNKFSVGCIHSCVFAMCLKNNVQSKITCFCCAQLLLIKYCNLCWYFLFFVWAHIPSYRCMLKLIKFLISFHFHSHLFSLYFLPVQQLRMPNADILLYSSSKFRFKGNGNLKHLFQRAAHIKYSSRRI